MRNAMALPRSMMEWADPIVASYVAAQDAEEEGDVERSIDVLKFGLNQLEEVEVERGDDTFAFARNVLGSLFHNSLAASATAADGDRPLDHYHRALELWPGNAMAAYNAGELCREAGRPQEAVEFYGKCVDLALLAPQEEGRPLSERIEHPFAAAADAACAQAMANAVYLYAVELHRLGRYDEAAPSLALLGARFRISRDAWDAARERPRRAKRVTPATNSGTGSAFPWISMGEKVKVWRDAVPRDVRDVLLRALAPGARFFTETNYGDGDQGYYSFSYDLSKAPGNAVEYLIQHLRQLLPPELRRSPTSGDGNDGAGAGTVTHAEWWCHSRPVGPSVGHQLHFDMDETILNLRNEVAHPRFSSVVYLSGGSRSGPTLVFDQRWGDASLAEEGWMVRSGQGTMGWEHAHPGIYFPISDDDL